MDRFSESVGFVSWNKPSTYNGISFKKVVNKQGDISYDILMSSDVYGKNDRFSKADAEIKINDEIFKLEVLKVGVNHFEYSRDLINCRVKVSGEIAEKIRNADKISMRFHKENGPSTTLDISDSILAEWKEVLDKEK